METQWALQFSLNYDVTWLDPKDSPQNYKFGQLQSIPNPNPNPNTLRSGERNKCLYLYE